MQIHTTKTALVVIDVQEKLAAVMYRQEALLRGLAKIVGGARILDMPTLCLEQNPTRMGHTIEPLRKLLTPSEPIGKMSFSSCGSNAFMDALQATGCKQVLIAGIETHICVFQTARDLIHKDYCVQVVVDAVSSRNPLDHDVALQRLAQIAAQMNVPSPLITAEAALFEHIQSAEHPLFRDILKIIR